MIESPPRVEEIKVKADSLLATFKELVHEGNVHRVTIKNEDGDPLVEFPLTAGVIGAIFFPQLVAVGAIAALAVDFTIVVERSDEEADVID